MNTPIVSASHPIGKYYCNDIGNNEIRISIITLQWPSCPTIRRTKSMVQDSMFTQSTKREGNNCNESWQRRWCPHLGIYEKKPKQKNVVVYI